MKQRTSILFAIAVVLAAGITAGPAIGQEKPFATAGVTEIAGTISFSSLTPVSRGETEDAITLLSLGPEISHFVTDGLSIGFSPGVTLLPGISVITPAEGDGMTLVQLFALPAWTIRSEGNVVHPFLAVPFGYTSASSGGDSQSGFSWGVKGGIKVEAAGHLLVTCYGQYLAITLNPENASERYGLNFLSFGVALGGFF